MTSMRDAIRAVNEIWEYKSDGWWDGWKFKSPGDCEDYALLVLKEYFGSEGQAKDALQSGEAKIWYVITNSGNGHAILELNDKYTDNRQRKWCDNIMDMDISKVKWSYPYWLIEAKLALGLLQ